MHKVCRGDGLTAVRQERKLGTVRKHDIKGMLLLSRIPS